MTSIKTSEKRPLEQDGDLTEDIHAAKKVRTDPDEGFGDGPVITPSTEPGPSSLAEGQIPPHTEIDDADVEDGEQNHQSLDGQPNHRRPEPKKGKSRRFRANPKRAKKEAEMLEKGEQQDGRRGTRTGKLDDNPPSTSTPRLPKRAVALLLGVCGTGFSGMQLQKTGVRTIEGELFKALVKAGAVSAENADDATKVSLQRAARTDAGVHFARNVVSMKMIIEIPGIEDLVAAINQELPPEIRLWGFTRTQNSFNARTSCDSRMYRYYFPSYALLPPRPSSVLGQRTKARGGPLETPHPFWADCPPSMDAAQLLDRKRGWRIDSATLDRFQETLSRYNGTHNFHNFTVGATFTDKSNQRYMKQVEYEQLDDIGGLEWVRVLFHGQSFMLHQRKMVALAILVCRTGTPASVIDSLYQSHKVHIPKAPALGLLLEEPVFSTYNLRVSETNAEYDRISTPQALDSRREPIEFTAYLGQVEAFKKAFILSKMGEQELAESTFDGWTRQMESYGGQDLAYLNPEGTLPNEAILKPGEVRPEALPESTVDT